MVDPLIPICLVGVSLSFGQSHLQTLLQPPITTAATVAIADDAVRFNATLLNVYPNFYQVSKSFISAILGGVLCGRFWVDRFPTSFQLS